VQVVGTPYTHHQNCVLVDTPASETTRRVTAFLGGLDLCAGRYDTPAHTLFRGLRTVFHGDVYNPTFREEEDAKKLGPGSRGTTCTAGRTGRRRTTSSKTSRSAGGRRTGCG